MADPREFTNLVLKYKESKDPILLKEIHRRSRPLVWGVIKWYGINWFPPERLEDISDDCTSFVLSKSIDRYDETKGAKFETFYVWWVRSHVLSRKLWYIRRQNVLLTPSIDDVVDISCISDTKQKETVKA